MTSIVSKFITVKTIPWLSFAKIVNESFAASHNFDTVVTVSFWRMVMATGSCAGIENYSRYLTGSKPGEPPPTCLNIFRTIVLCSSTKAHDETVSAKGLGLSRQRKVSTASRNPALPVVRPSDIFCA
jgi:hypothetical protein